MATDYWTNTIDLSTPAGVALKKLVGILPNDRPFRITLFGSAPIQITVEPRLLSADIGLFCDEEDLSEFVREAGLDREHSDFYIQVCSGLNFRTSPHWGARVLSTKVGHVTFLSPPDRHPDREAESSGRKGSGGLSRCDAKNRSSHAS